jgi:hypothetical protein
MPQKYSKTCPKCGTITALYGTGENPTTAEGGNCWNCHTCGWHYCVYPGESVMGKYANYNANEGKIIWEAAMVSSIPEKETTSVNKFIKTIVFENGPLVGQRASLKDLGYGTSKDQKDWLPGTHSVKIPRSILEEANVFPELELDAYGLHRPLKHRDVVPTKVYYTLHYTTHKGKKAADGTALGTYEITGYYRVGGSGRNVPVIPDLLEKISQEKKAFLQKQTEAASKLVGIHVKECEPHGQLCYHTTCNSGLYDHTSTLETAMHMCYCGKCTKKKRDYKEEVIDAVEVVPTEPNEELAAALKKIHIDHPNAKPINETLVKISNNWDGGMWEETPYDGGSGWCYSGHALNLMGIKVPYNAPRYTKFIWKEPRWVEEDEYDDIEL